MTLATIRQEVERLRALAVPLAQNGTLPDCIWRDWRRTVLDNLRDGLAINSGRLLDRARRIRFLQDQWNFIKGSFLCYTAHPNSDITRLLISFAIETCEGDEAPLSYLMPGVWLKSLSNDFQDLDTPHHTPNVISSVIRVLNRYILSDSNRYLYPVKLLNSLEIAPGDALPFNPYFNDRNLDRDNLNENLRLNQNE